MLRRKNKFYNDVINIDANSHAMEQYKSVRANIEFLEVDNKYKTILITSPEAGVGKTTTSFHLAKAFALRGEKVLFIGGDLRNPSLNKYLDSNQKQSEGLVSAILKKTSVEDSIVKSTELDNLFFIHAGFTPPNPAELLETISMKDIMDILKENFDRIIIDSPPLLPVIDAKVLSGYSDGIILVVRSDYSDREAYQKVVNEVKSMPIKMLGTILNAVDVGKNEQYYYYY